MKIQEQQMKQNATDLNHILLTFGMCAIMFLTAYATKLVYGPLLVTMSAYTNTTQPDSALGSTEDSSSTLAHDARGRLLSLSRCLSFILIIVCAASQWYKYNYSSSPSSDSAPAALPIQNLGEQVNRLQERKREKRKRQRQRKRQGSSTVTPDPAPDNSYSEHIQQIASLPILQQDRPAAGGDICGTHQGAMSLESKPQAEAEINSWACMIMLIVTVTIMIVTSEFLLESIEHLKTTEGLQEEFYGLIVVPLASFAAGGFSAIFSFLHQLIGLKKWRPSKLAKARPIDLSIQFIMLWMPFIVLLGWSMGKPMLLAFDIVELVVLVSSSYMVNSVTARARTNWVKGLIMVSLYVMIAICAWFYQGQREQDILLSCPYSFSATLQQTSDTNATASSNAFALNVKVLL